MKWRKPWRVLGTAQGDRCGAMAYRKQILESIRAAAAALTDGTEAPT